MLQVLIGAGAAAGTTVTVAVPETDPLHPFPVMDEIE
jgi:hypothetical protein